MSKPAGSVPPGASGPSSRPPRQGGLRPVDLILLLPLIGTLVPEFYNRAAPAIGGMPFFYWYQLAWIPVSVSLTYLVYRVTRERG